MIRHGLLYLDWRVDGVDALCLTVSCACRQDEPCTDHYTNQVFIYEGHYIGLPAAMEHFPEPPAWVLSNDGTFDTRLLHSREGKQWSYVNDDRAPWLPRGPQAGPPTYSPTAVPGPDEPQCWRESMTAAVRGYVVRGDTIHM